MSYFAKFTFLFISSIVLAFTIGYWAGSNKYKCSDEITKIEIKTKILSDRITACEEKGGRYNLVWINIRHEYAELCKIAEIEITNF